MAEEGLTGERRKLVTALFCDVVGSTDLGEAQDPELVRALMEEWFAEAEQIVARHGGLVEKFIGDAVTAVFGVPVVHEDDALRACQAAAALLANAAARDTRLRTTLDLPFQVRVGIESGVAVVGDATRGSTFATGPAVNLAARLQQAAAPGACLVGPGCRELVPAVVDLDEPGPLVLKGVPRPVLAARLRSVPALPPERPQAVALVGRDEPLSLLVAAFDAVGTGEGSRLVTVVGEAGMGKTRIIEQFLGGLAPTATVLRSRCLPYGDGVAWWPLVEFTRQAVGLTGGEATEQALQRLAAFVADDGPLVAAVLGAVSGLGGTPSHDDLAWAFGRLLEQVAAGGPVALVVEDVHWAHPSLVEVLDDVTTWLGDLPVLVLVDARPEFTAAHPSWGSASGRATAVRLGPLSDADVDRLVGIALGGPVAGDLCSRVRSLSAGNPLFVHQMAGLLTQSGRLTPSGAGWRLDPSEQVGVPAGMTALIASRIDQLPDAVRQLAGAAAVMGQLFYRRALVDLGLPDVGRGVGLLLRNGMVRVCGSDLPGEQALQFEHQLVRDAAYDSLTAAVRATQHERFARWLLREHPSPAYEGIVGSHLESAYRCRAAPGRADDERTALGVEAAERLARAGRQLAKVDEPASIELFRRAVGLVADGRNRWALELELAFRLFDSPLGLTEARSLTDSLSAGAAAQDVVLSLSVDVLRKEIAVTGGEVDVDVLDRAARALATATAAEPPGLSQLLLWEARAEIANVRGDLRGVRAANLGAAEAAEQLGYDAAATGLRRAADFQSLFDPTPVDECREAWRGHLQRAGDRSAQLNAQASLLFLADIGGADEGLGISWHELDDRSRQVRTRIWEVVTVLRSGAALALGQWQEAYEAQSRLCDDLQSSGSAGRLSTEAGNAAIAAAHLGDEPSVGRWIDVAVRHGSEDDASTRGLVAAARAWVAARHGDRTTWQAESSTADSALPDDMVMDRALVAATLAQAAELLGETDGAATYRARAVTLYRLKGAAQAASRL